jgi:TATA element modulatory factor
MWGSIGQRVTKAIDAFDNQLDAAIEAQQAEDESGTPSKDKDGKPNHKVVPAKSRLSSTTGKSGKPSSSSNPSNSASNSGGGWGIMSAISNVLSEESYTPEDAERDKQKARAARVQAESLKVMEEKKGQKVEEQEKNKIKSVVSTAAPTPRGTASSTTDKSDSKSTKLALPLPELSSAQGAASSAEGSTKDNKSQTKTKSAAASSWLANNTEPAKPPVTTVQEIKEKNTETQEQVLEEASDDDDMEELLVIQASASENCDKSVDDQENDLYKRESTSMNVGLEPPPDENQDVITGTSTPQPTVGAQANNDDMSSDSEENIPAWAEDSANESPGEVEVNTLQDTSLKRSVEDSHALVVEDLTDVASTGPCEAEVKNQLDGMKSELKAAQLEHKEECRHLQEIIKQRERSLEAANHALAEAQAAAHGHERLQEKLVELQTAAAEGDEAAALREQVEEQQQRLEMYEEEGRALARKQSEMEKLVRKTKVDSKAQEGELKSLREVKVTLEVQIANLKAELASHVSNAANASKSMKAQQSASQITIEKLQKFEKELTSKSDELATANTSIATLTEKFNALTSEHETLKRAHDAGAEEAEIHRANRQDVESREGVLRATNSQLQESLRTHMADAAAREERLHDELADVRRRWQDATSARDAMAGEATSATMPLLAELSRVQESQRMQASAWQQTEATLSERALRAESAQEVLEHKLRSASGEVENMQRKLSDAYEKHEKQIEDKVAAEKALTTVQMQLEAAASASRELEAQLALETATLKGLRNSMNQMEQVHETKCTRLQNQVDQAAAEIATLKNDLQTVNRLAGTPMQAAAPTPILEKSSPERHTSVSDTLHHGSINTPLPGQSSPVTPGFGDSLTGHGDSGQSYAANTRMKMQMQQRNDELQSAQARIKQLERAREALLSEVTTLSSRNAQLEDDAATVPEMRSEMNKVRSEAEVLLVLLGEKEEELEAIQADMREVKTLYRNQLDTFLMSSNPNPEA